MESWFIACLTMEQEGSKILPRIDARVRWVERVLAKLVPASGMPVEEKWTVYVIDDPQTLDAFVLPGNKVLFVYSKILPVCKNDDGLAALLSHS